MKKFRRILSMLLCVAMLLSVVMLSACDKNTDDNGRDGDDDRSTESGTTVQAVRLKNSLEKGEIISAKDIEVVDEKESNLPEGYIAKRVAVIGKKMLETAEKGAYLSASMIEGGVSEDKESNEIDYEALRNELKAELLAELEHEIATGGIDASSLGYVLITDYTMPNTGEDVSDAIQRAIDENPHRTIYFPDGEYILGKPIATSAHPDRAVSLNLSNFAVLKAADNWREQEAMVRLGGAESANNIHLAGSNYYFSGGVVDGNGRAKGIAIESGRETLITRTSIKNTQVGIHIKHGANSGSSDADIVTVNIVGNAKPDSIGVLLEGHDNTLTNMRIAAVQTGVLIKSGTNSLSNIHPLFIYAPELHDRNPDMYGEVDLIDYSKSIGFDDVSNGTNWYDFCYSDQMATGFRFRSGSAVFQNCFVMWYNTNGSHEIGFDCTGRFNSSILNCQVWLKSGVETCIFLRVANKGFGVVENPIFNDNLNTDKSYLDYLDGKLVQ
ncbi:MAG: flagella basal body P-ring formation protein FlgA [Clostridia bacterium]|nr:flagella basal body P-ring formation protein FlgA [Clostridia bacterium]